MQVPPFKWNHSEGREHPSHSPMTSPSTEPSSLPSQGYKTKLTVAVRTSSRLKRSSDSAELSNTAELPVTTKKQCYLSHNSTTSEDWNLMWSQIPLHHHHPRTSPFRHQQLSPPSPEYTTPLTMAKSTLETLRRSPESPVPFVTAVHLVKMTKQQLLLCDLTKSNNWNLNHPLNHHLLLTSPFRHLPYCATCKSW